MRVSTHSRPKAAATTATGRRVSFGSFNTQPPEGGCFLISRLFRPALVSTHSRPKAAESTPALFMTQMYLFQHTAARRRLSPLINTAAARHGFNTQPPEGGCIISSALTALILSFNTQPPEGGWSLICSDLSRPSLFQHTAARRRLFRGRMLINKIDSFNTQPPEGGWSGYNAQC